MAEPANHTLAYLCRLDEKLDRLHGDVGELRTEVGERFDRMEGRLGGIEEELLVLNGIALRLEGREVETTGLKALFDRHERSSPSGGAASPSWKRPTKAEGLLPLSSPTGRSSPG